MKSLGYSRPLVLSAVGVLVLLVTGCGPSRPETVPVSGMVTVDGKAPPGPGLIYFITREAAEGFDRRPATAEFDATGHYTAKTFVPGDGLMPGRYGVSVECWEVAPNMDGRPMKSYIAPRYGSPATSGLEEIAIEPGSSGREIDFELFSR